MSEYTLPTMTVGELRKAIADLPDEMPVLAYDIGRDNYVNVPSVETPQAEDIAVTFNLANNFDTRQW